jgi:hypothetical protein
MGLGHPHKHVTVHYFELTLEKTVNKLSQLSLVMSIKLRTFDSYLNGTRIQQFLLKKTTDVTCDHRNAQ